MVVVFLNIGNFYGRNDGGTGSREPEFFTLSLGNRYHWHAQRLSRQDRPLTRYAERKSSANNPMVRIF